MKVLLSIKPKYVEKIFLEQKKFEYRKSIFKKENIDTIIIYETKPVGKIVGEIEIKSIYCDTPENIWNKTKKYSGMEKNDFFNYFSKKDIAYAIEFEHVIKYKNPKDMPYSPPQLYKYI